MSLRPTPWLHALALGLALTALPALAQATDTAPQPAPPAVTAPTTRDTPEAATEAQGITLRVGEEAPYPGGPVPRGAQLIDKPRTGLFVTGTVLLGLSWVPSILAGMITILAGGLVGTSGGSSGSSVVGIGTAMLVPVIGPLFGVGLGLAYSDSLPWQYTAFLAADFVVQAAGFGLALWAHFNPRQVLRGTGSPMDGAVSWAILPGAGPTLSGATFALRF